MFTSNEEIRWLRRTGVPIQRIVAILAAHGRLVSRQKIAGICKGVPKPLKNVYYVVIHLILIFGLKN